MNMAIAERPMAKKAGRPKTSDRDDATCRINRVILGRAQAVAKYRGIPVAQLLSELLDLPVQREYLAMVKESDTLSKKPKGSD